MAFSDSVEGTKVIAMIYSMVETAKADGFYVSDYLKVLLEDLSDIDVHACQEEAENLLPWSKYMKYQFAKE